MQQTSLRIINSADCTVSFSSDVYLDWDVEEGGSGGTLLIPAEVRVCFTNSFNSLFLLFISVIHGTSREAGVP